MVVAETNSKEDSGLLPLCPARSPSSRRVLEYGTLLSSQCGHFWLFGEVPAIWPSDGMQVLQLSSGPDPSSVT